MSRLRHLDHTVAMYAEDASRLMEVQPSPETLYMKPTQTLLLLALLAVAAPAAMAQKALLNAPAPDFSADECVNAPEAITLEQCKGEVVLLDFWGTK